MIAFTAHVPNVLISDIGMPGQDGYDLIQKVRAHWQFYRDRRPETYGDIAKDLL